MNIVARFGFLVALVLTATACARPANHDLSGSVLAFDFQYHSNIIVAEAQRLAGGDYFGLPEDERNAVWLDAAGLVRGTPCGEGVGAFPEIHTGTQVQVVNDGGGVVGTGVLLDGFVDLLPFPDVQAKVIAVCRFDFEIKDLPDLESYMVLIGEQQQLFFSKAQLESQGWVMTIELGVQR